MRGNQRTSAAVDSDSDGDGNEIGSEQRSITRDARDAVLNLETETELGEDDYDPTQEVEESLAVFAQGQLQGTALGGQFTVENLPERNL